LEIQGEEIPMLGYGKGTVLVVMSFALAGAMPAWAAKGASPAEPKFEFAEPTPLPAGFSTPVEKMVEQAKRIREGKLRVIASGSVTPSEDAMSEPYKKLIKDLQNLDVSKGGQAMADLLADLEKQMLAPEADKLPQDFRFFAAQLLVLKPYGGFFWRMEPVVKKATMAQVRMLMVLRRMADLLLVYLPYPQWEAAALYITEPAPGVEQFAGEEAVQKFFGTDVRAQLIRSIMWTRALDFSTTPMVWDNKVRFTADAKIPGATDRLKVIGRGRAQRRPGPPLQAALPDRGGERLLDVPVDGDPQGGGLQHGLRGPDLLELGRAHPRGPRADHPGARG
jgi:hypothetical protein